MSYSRWGSSYWYTFHSIQPVGVKETRDNAIFEVCCVASFTAKEIRDDIAGCIKRAKRACRRDRFKDQPSERDLDELHGYMTRFVTEINRQSKRRGSRNALD